jgi:hypothetical protein
MDREFGPSPAAAVRVAFHLQVPALPCVDHRAIDGIVLEDGTVARFPLFEAAPNGVALRKLRDRSPVVHHRGCDSAGWSTLCRPSKHPSLVLAAYHGRP